MKDSKTLFLSYINSLYGSLYLILAFLHLFLSPDQKIKILFILMLMGIISFILIREKLRANIYDISTVIIFLAAINLIGSLRTENSLTQSSLFLANFLLGLFLFKNKHNSRVYYFLIIGFFLVFLSKFMMGINPNSLFNEASRNWVSIIMQTTAIVYYIIRYENNEKIPILPALLVCIVSIWAIGRAGIITSFILLFAIIYLRTKNLTKKNKIKIFLLVILVLLILIFILRDSISQFFDEIRLFQRFEEKGMDNSYRTSMIKEYINHINLKTFLIGYDYSQNNFFRYWDLNPHNSFIRLHYYTGVIGLLFSLFLCMLLVVYLIKNPLYFVLLSILLMRSFTDTIIFFGKYDFLIFYFTIDFIHKFRYDYRKISLKILSVEGKINV